MIRTRNDMAEAFAALQFCVALILMFGAPLLAKPNRGNLEMSDDFLNTLLGVLLGGLVTLISSLVVNGEVAKQQEKDRRLGLGYAIRYKVLKLADAVLKFQRHVNEAIGDQPTGPDLWPQLPPFHGSTSTPIDFTSDEVALFAMCGDGGYASELLDLASLHNLLLEIRHTYNTERQALGYMIAGKGYVTFAGRVGSVSDQARHDPEVAPHLIEVSDLAETLIKYSREGAPHAEKIVAAISGKLTSMLNDARFQAGIRVVPPAAAN